ncbi:MAG TPA: hypothetical protein VIM73_11625, partial [Polyangiaceae bacterium]
AYDGATQIETLPVPLEQPATITGSAPITPTTLATCNGLTLVFAQPAAVTLTLASPSLTAQAAGLKAATATVASPVTLHASDLLGPGIAALLANPRTLTFTTAGTTPSDAPASVTITGTDYTGATQTETLNLSQTAGAATSAKVYATITSLAYLAADGTGATIAVGYGAAFASVAELVAEFNTLTAAAPITVTAFDSQSASGHFLAFFTNLTTSGAGGTGSSAVVTLNASPGTGATLFGFSNSQTATGLPATFAPPWTNQVWTFAVGAYAKGDTYTLAASGPAASISAITAAVSVAIPAWKNNNFGFIAVTAPPSSAANAAALQAACTSLSNASRANNSAPIVIMTGTPFHTASANQTTNAANILTADNAITAAFSGSSPALDVVVVDDCYVTGATALRAGSYRRSAVFAAAVKAATLEKLGSNLGEGIVQGISLRGPDLATLARDESSATVKLGPTGGGNTGAGFCVLLSTPAGLGSPKFASGITRAGSGSYFRSYGVVQVALEMSIVGYTITFGWQGQTWPVEVTPANAKQIRQSFAKARAGLIQTALKNTLTPKGKDPSVSTFSVSIDTSGDFLDAGQVPVLESFVPLGEVFDIQLIITAQGTIITNAPGAT